MKLVLRTMIAMAFLLANHNAMAEDIVAPEFRGDWVPATASCTSALRLRVTGTAMTLIVAGIVLSSRK